METAENSIIGWYQKQTIFITGGSGFIGKALIFKLLKCGVKKIFILIRAKKGQDPEERLDAIANHEIYEPLRAKDPNFRAKLVAISGDVTEPGLAISTKDRKIMQDEVNIVFHVAASVKFDDSLTKAVHYNLRSTRDMVEIAKTLINLKMFHYVSTGYSNSEYIRDGKMLEERLYPEKIKHQKFIEFIERTPEEIVGALEEKVKGSSTNTYTFTKHLAEHLVSDAGKFMPIVISRPQIVLPAEKEPYPGWMDNISSPTAIVGGSGKGVLRLYIGVPDAPKAYTSVDLVVDTILTSTWRESVKDTGKNCNIYHTEYTPITTGELKTLCLKLVDTNPCHNSLWKPHLVTTDSKVLFLLGHFIIHLIPGFFFDCVLRVFGQTPRLVRLYRKLYLALLALHPILNTRDNFQIKNVFLLKKDIPNDEREIFPLGTIESKQDVLQYLKQCDYGFRKLIGDPPYPTKEDFQHYKRLMWLERVFFGTFTGTILYFLPFEKIWIYIASSLSSFVESLTEERTTTA